MVPEDGSAGYLVDVWEPWAIATSGDVTPIEPDPWLFEPGAWDHVEEALGTPLPRDYKDLIGDGLACVFDGELFITSPFDPNPNVNLLMVAARSAFALAYLRHLDPSEYAFTVYPESGGWLGWGVDGGGGNYHWDTTDADPDRWTVRIEGRPLDPGFERHDLTLMAYLEALAAGTVKSAALTDWPGHDPKVRRVVPRGR